MAYKIDTLIINRRIEEAGRPAPKVIRLGTLSEIAQELGSASHNWSAIKKALAQNATASVTAKITYRTHEKNTEKPTDNAENTNEKAAAYNQNYNQDHKPNSKPDGQGRKEANAAVNQTANKQGERWLEAVFNRYSVIFTGETLPSGLTADAVYIVLNDIYQEILSTAIFRPLDYAYMKALPPGAQRFYEIASYQIFAAVHHNNPRAKLLYSEYCLLSTATRYFTYDQVKKQMYKVLKPHMASGYLAKVSYEAITNERGEADWWMYLTPGPNAGREYATFTEVKREGQKSSAREGKKAGQANSNNNSGKAAENVSTPTLWPLAAQEKLEATNNDTTAETLTKALIPNETPSSKAQTPARQTSETQAARGHHPTSEEQSLIADLIAELVQADLNRGDAARFADEKPEVCRRQLDYLPFVKRFKSSRGAYLRRAIEGDYGPPAAYAQAQAQREAAEAARRRQAENALQAATQSARQSHENRHRAAFYEFLGEEIAELEKTHYKAFAAFREAEEEQRQRLVNSPLADRPMFRDSIARFDTLEQRAERFLKFCMEEGRLWDLDAPGFWDWDTTHNPESFQP